MNKKIVRLVSVALMAALVAVLCLGLTACSSKEDNEKLIRDSITSEFTSIKSLDSSTMKELVSSVDSETDLSMFGITSEQFVNAWLDGFDFKVNSVTVDGKTAKASVDITIKDFSAVVSDWMTSINSLTTDTAFLKEMAGKSMDQIQDAIYKKAGSMLMDSFAKASTKTSTIELPYKLDGNTWQPAEDFGAIMSDAFLGDLSNLGA